MNRENSELALVKLMELFNHSSVTITKRYLGLRQEEILPTYDCLSFKTMRRRHILRRNLFIVPVQILSPLCYYKLQKPTFLMIFVVTIPFTEIKEKVGGRLLRIIQDTFSDKNSILDTEYRTF